MAFYNNFSSFKYFQDSVYIKNEQRRMVLVEDPHFDYDNTKEKFYKLINRCYRNKKKTTRKWTKERILKTIAEIKQGELLISANLIHNLTQRQLRLREEYEVNPVNGEDIIFQKSESKKPVRIVAYEEYFDIILEAHRLSAHGRGNKIENVIRPLYYIPFCTELISIFVKLCNFCKRKFTKPKFNNTAQVGFIDMTGQPDGPFNHILYYIDSFTSFMIIRAMESFMNELELSAELLKIFTDFGPPDKIQSYYSVLINRSVHLLEKHFPTWDITVIQTNQDLQRISNTIMNLVQKWMTQNECLNWSIGCRMLQFQINNTVKTFDSPFRLVFGFSSNCKSVNNCEPNKEPTYKNKSNTKSVNAEEDDAVNEIDAKARISASNNCITIKKKNNNQIIDY